MNKQIKMSNKLNTKYTLVGIIIYIEREGIKQILSLLLRVSTYKQGMKLITTPYSISNIIR